MAECEHLIVTKGTMWDDEPIWTCTECADQFVEARNMAPVLSFLREVKDMGERVPMHLRAEADQLLVEVFDLDE